MKRFASSFSAIGLTFALVFVGSNSATAVDSEVEMNLNQTILVWNDEYYTDFSNWDVALSTVSTVDGAVEQIGYTFEPALDPGPCPAPYEQYNFCGGSISSAALNPVTRSTYALVGGADATNSTVYLINPQTGAPTFQALLTDNGTELWNVRSIFFDANGNMFAWWEDQSAREHKIYSVDIDSGALTLEQSYALADFPGNVLGITADETGQIWAFSVNAQTDETFGSTLGLGSNVVTDEFTLADTSFFKGSFDANGYLWFVTSDNKLMTLDINAGDTVAQESTVNLPDKSGAFVISDVPFPVSSGVTEGEKLTAGQEVNTNILNARANSGYSVVIYSTPRELASGTVSAGGQAQIPITIPANLEPGNHEIVFTFIAPNGRTVTETYQVTVAALAATGSDVATQSLTASAFLLLGLFAVIYTSRRRKANL